MSFWREKRQRESASLLSTPPPVISARAHASVLLPVPGRPGHENDHMRMIGENLEVSRRG